MTDTTVPANNPGAPVEVDDSFDASFDAFLNHKFDVDDAATQMSDEEAAPPAGEEAPIVAPQEPAVSTVSPAPASTEPPAPAAPNAAPPAGNATDPATPAADDDSVLMATMLGLGDSPPSAPAAPAATPPAAPAASAEPEHYMPLPESVAIPDNLAAAIFTSEDPNAQRQALGTLLANYGNAILALADKRMAEHHVPQSLNRFQSVQAAQQEAARVQDDFYNAFPDLRQHRTVVAKAFKAIEAQNPTAQYGPEIRDRAGNLARKTLQQLGLAQPAAPAPTVPATPAPVKAPAVKSVGFEAGAARPGGGGNGAENSPAALYDELTRF